MGWQIKDKRVSTAIGYALIAGLVGLVAWVWFGVFGFSPFQFAADVVFVVGGSLFAGSVAGGPLLKKWNL